MKASITHPSYGEIVYSESIWTGKKSLIINGTAVQPVSKTEFMIGENKAVLKGNYLTGVSLSIGDETIELSPKSKWYEIVLAVLPIVFLLTWGNSATLFSIFPVIGGAIGGALGALGSVFSMLLMKKSQSPAVKILTGIGFFAATVIVGFVAAVAFVMLTASI